VTISKKTFVVVLIILILIIAAVALFDHYKPQRVIYTTEDSGYGVSAPYIPDDSSDSVKSLPPYYYYEGNPDVTDTREFLKTNYSAQVFTRDVRDVVEEVENTVHDVEGRVDDISTSEKYGSVSFVIPKSNLSEFRDVIESLTHEKLIVENVSSRNLLGQKQSIEERTESVEERISDLQEEKESLQTQHGQRVASLQSQISDLQAQLNSVRNEKASATDEEEIQRLEDQENLLIQRISSLQSSLANENQNYSSRISSLNSEIEGLQENLDLLSEEDTDFMNDIETVEGHVNATWISWWDIADKFTPTPMWLNTLILIILILWFLSWRGFIPRVQVR
jgi:predicted  nucleic acid-binding Zn-ribbon protein